MGLGRAFWRFWAATVLANVGDGIRLAAFPLLAASLTDDPALVAVVAAAAGLPWLVTGLVAGLLADRAGARLLLVTADLTRTAVLTGLVVALVTGTATIPVVAAAAFLLGVGETVRDTTAQTVVPRLVPTGLVERANGRMTAGEVAGNELVGPLVGASLFAAGAALPFVANSAALAFGVLLVLTVPAAVLAHRPLTAPTAEAAPAGLWGGLRWLSRHRTLRALAVVGAVVALADSAWFAVFVLYTEVRLDLGAVGFGLLLATGAVGGLGGAWLADRVIGVGRHRTVLTWSMAATAVAPALLLVAPDRWAAVVVVVVTSAAFGVFNVAAGSLRHRLTPGHVLGRVVAVWRTAVLGASGVGALAGGLVASRQGLQAPFVLSALLGLLAVAVWWHATRRTPDLLA
ncbi:MFS transporter [Pseudokineococcus marinus]|uniref:MFS transporter n=1 Tax=Pseudokineococcus marinus TaxID=351215 RepID=A0A849BSH9_9ACTN|nr:MFS transporter [Pseudokineococcus marinus]NNH23424.1 MFS transporter [Pseudokineococcus marinus]